MKVKLLQLYTPIPNTPGLHFGEAAVIEAIKATTLPLISHDVQEVDALFAMMNGHAANNMPILEHRCTRLWVEGQHLYGEVEFLSTPNLHQADPAVTSWFARVRPLDNSQTFKTAEDNQITEFYFSSIDWQYK